MHRRSRPGPKTLEDEVDALRERVETLERIVTDDKYGLDREIEKLDDD